MGCVYRNASLVSRTPDPGFGSLFQLAVQPTNVTSLPTATHESSWFSRPGNRSPIGEGKHGASKQAIKDE